MPNHKSNRVCDIDGCGLPHLAKGYCNRHWLRLSRFGDPLGGGVLRGGKCAAFIAKAIGFDSIGECLLWPFALKSDGYASVHIDGRHHNAHNVICKSVHGPAPTPEHEAGHSCGNRACCNPLHIRWVTPGENGQDRIFHGTNCAGEAHVFCRLSDEQVAEIRRIGNSLPRAEVGRMFGVSRSHVSGIITGRQRFKATSAPLPAEDIAHLLQKVCAA